MSVAARAPANDFPPNAWRGCWLESPRWFQFSCAAVVVIVLLTAVLEVRLYFVGLRESPEVVELRDRGARVVYHVRTIAYNSWNGRTNQDVSGIELHDVAEDDYRYSWSSQF